MATNKYPRTYHVAFSPGATSDDKIQPQWLECINGWSRFVLTEKMDGENTSLSKDGVFARSHTSPSISPWSQWIRQDWASKMYLMDDGIEIFSENLEGIHSIEYENLSSYFYVFAVRVNNKDMWLSWEDVKMYADYFGYPTVPLIATNGFDYADKKQWVEIANQPSMYGSIKEGMVIRNAYAYSTDDFSINVLKYVRANHVQTEEHWTRNWRRAKLKN